MKKRKERGGGEELKRMMGVRENQDGGGREGRVSYKGVNLISF